MTDYKRLCAELLQAWDNAPTPSDFIDTEGYGFFAKIRAALAEPEPSVDDVLLLAAIIREVDGTNRSSASRLAEDILSHPASRWGK